MNRRELFKVGGYLITGAACSRIARLLPTTEATTGSAERFKAAAIYGKPQGNLIHIRVNSYPPKDYVTRLERLTIEAHRAGSKVEGVTRSLTKFQRKLDEAHRPARLASVNVTARETETQQVG